MSLTKQLAILTCLAGSVTVADDASAQCEPTYLWTRTTNSTEVVDLTASRTGDVVLVQRPTNAVTVLAPDGSTRWFADFRGVNGGFANVQAVATDSTGAVYVAGSVNGAVDLDPTDAVALFLGGFGANSHAFVVRLASDGGYSWARTFGPANAADVACTTGDEVLVAGSFSGAVDFDPSSRSDVHNSSSSDLFLSRFGGDGSYRGVSTTLGGSFSYVHFVPTPNDAVYLAFHCYGKGIDFDPGDSTEPHDCTSQEVALMKFSGPGTQYLGTRFAFLGLQSWSVAVDSLENVLVAAPTPNNQDATITKLDDNMQHVWTRTFGGPGEDQITTIAVTPDDALLLGGYFSFTFDFDPGDGKDYRSSHGIYDAFIMRMETDGDYAWAKTFGGDFVEQPQRVVFGDSTTFLLAGTYNSANADFDYSDGVDIPSTGKLFVMRSYCFVGIGDFNADSRLDLGDFAILQNCFGDAAPSPSFQTCSDGDLDSNAAIGLQDVSRFSSALNGPTP